MKYGEKGLYSVNVHKAQYNPEKYTLIKKREGHPIKRPISPSSLSQCSPRTLGGWTV